jgi:hypothetical protein
MGGRDRRCYKKQQLRLAIEQVGLSFFFYEGSFY